MFKNKNLESVNIQKINLTNLPLYHLIVIQSIFRLFVFGFVLFCALYLHNARESNKKLKWKKRNMCCTVVCYRMVWPRYLAWCDQYRGMIGGCNLVYNWPGTCPRPGLGHDISFIICIPIPGDICVNTCSYFYQIHNWPGNRRQQLKYNRSFMEMNTSTITICYYQN